MKAILDANRNALMLLDLKFSIGTLGMGSAAFIGALYGMNVPNFLEGHNWAFFGLSTFSLGLGVLVCTYGLTKLRRVQRVSMWGEQGRKSNRSWADVDQLPALPGETRTERLKRFEENKKQALKAYEQEQGLSDLRLILKDSNK